MVVIMEIPLISAYIYFAITCLTAPTFGVIAGGLVSQACGGYASPRSFGICCFVSFLGTVMAMPVPFITNIYLFGVMLWILIFLGGFSMPILTGILITSVP